MNELSLGIQKLINLFLALIWKPKIIFLDEFATNLDIKITKKILIFVKIFCKQNNITIVATSHQTNEIESMATRIFTIKS
jgi:ABC-2 type transport system ATP-binding protein